MSPARGLVFGQPPGVAENGPHRPGQGALVAIVQAQALPDFAGRAARAQAGQAPPDHPGLILGLALQERLADQGIRGPAEQPGQGPVDEYPPQVRRQPHHQFGLVLDHGQIAPPALAQFAFGQAMGGQFGQHAAQGFHGPGSVEKGNQGGQKGPLPPPGTLAELPLHGAPVRHHLPGAFPVFGHVLRRQQGGQGTAEPLGPVDGVQALESPVDVQQPIPEIDHEHRGHGMLQDGGQPGVDPAGAGPRNHADRTAGPVRAVGHGHTGHGRGRGRSARSQGTVRTRRVPAVPEFVAGPGGQPGAGPGIAGDQTTAGIQDGHRLRRRLDQAAGRLPGQHGQALAGQRPGQVQGGQFGHGPPPAPAHGVRSRFSPPTGTRPRPQPRPPLPAGTCPARIRPPRTSMYPYKI